MRRDAANFPRDSMSCCISAFQPDAVFFHKKPLQQDHRYPNSQETKVSHASQPLPTSGEVICGFYYGVYKDTWRILR